MTPAQTEAKTTTTNTYRMVVTLRMSPAPMGETQ